MSSISTTPSLTEPQLKKDIALRWWYRVGRTLGTKDEFLENRENWEQLQRELHNHLANTFAVTDLLPDHKECKSLIRTLDKEGLLGHDTIDIALSVQECRRQNRIRWGHAEGIEGFERRIARMAEASSDSTPATRDYILQYDWQMRSRRYLDENCSSPDGTSWVCEMCGISHAKNIHPRTIHVHHNTYSRPFNGNESDIHLVGVCSGLCHDLADIARRIRAGRIDSAVVNDLMRPLLNDD